MQTSARLIKRVPPQWIVACSTAWMFLMALLIVVFDRAGLGLWGVMVPLWFYILGAGFTFPCVQVLALANHGAQAGTAASLLGCRDLPHGRDHLPVVGWLGVESATPMGAVQAGCILLAAAALLVRGPAADGTLHPLIRRPLGGTLRLGEGVPPGGPARVRPWCSPGRSGRPLGAGPGPVPARRRAIRLWCARTAGPPSPPGHVAAVR